MNKCERIKMVKAMEFIARQINDEFLLDAWLIAGVADGDIEYGDLIATSQDEKDLDYYIEDKEFAYLMRCFLNRMKMASKNGGLYCDGILSEHVTGLIFPTGCGSTPQLVREDHSPKFSIK